MDRIVVSSVEREGIWVAFGMRGPAPLGCRALVEDLQRTVNQYMALVADPDAFWLNVGAAADMVCELANDLVGRHLATHLFHSVKFDDVTVREWAAWVVSSRNS